MNKAIVTIVNGEKYEKIWGLTEPFFIRYAEKCDADLIVLKGTEGKDLPSAHWLKFSIYDLLHKEFDRVAFIDADIIIRDDAPSLFDVVPEHEFGIFDEGEFTSRSICIHEVMKVYKVEEFRYDGHTYYNTGVMVVSRRHRHIFKVIEEVKPLRNSFGEQTFLNMKIMISGCPVHKLNFRYNRMSLMDRILGVSRLDSYLIHYAGDGDKLFPKMERDIKCWEDAKGLYEYRKKLFIWALGGLGDVISAEPVVRYIREHVYPDADIWLMSEQCEVYSHIEGLNLTHDYPKIELDAVIEMNTHQLPWDGFGKYMPFQFTHCVDWVSAITLGQQLPDDDKEIRLTYEPEHLKEARDICPTLENLVLVHPGIAWVSKTFPIEYWQSIIDGLKAEGFEVGIIGKDVKESHGVLPVNAEGCVDFRNKLSMKGLFALISKAKTLISNDSAPIHIAGAFDNNIILIPTCKHPDHILPFRNRSKDYKTKALYKKVMEGDNLFNMDANEVWIAKDIPKGHTIEEYLPEVADVIETTKQFDRNYTRVYSSCKQMEVLQ